MILKENLLVIKLFRNLKLITFLSIFGLLSSCVTQRDVEYLYDSGVTTFNEAEFSDYKLKPNDELFVRINSLDEGAANVFSSAGAQTSTYTGGISPYGASLQSYSIDKEGNLLLPLIGNIFVKDKTLSQVSLILRDSLEHILNHPIVSIKLVNRYVTILGEVRNPGHFTFSQDKISIYDAIGLAGDITDYGNRHDVILVRNENGENHRISLDLGRSDALASTYYNIRPNDIIYIKPLKKKFWSMRQFPYSVLLSTITTAILLYEVIKDY